MHKNTMKSKVAALLVVVLFSVPAFCEKGSVAFRGRLFQENGSWFLFPDSQKGRLSLLDVPFKKDGKAYDGLFVEIRGSWADCPGTYPCVRVSQLSPAVYDPLPNSTKQAIRKRSRTKTE